MKPNEIFEFKMVLTKDDKLELSTSWNFKNVQDSDKISKINAFAKMMALLQRAKLIHYVRTSIAEYGIIHKDLGTNILLLDKIDEQLQALLMEEMYETQAVANNDNSDDKPIWRSIDAFNSRD